MSDKRCPICEGKPNSMSIPARKDEFLYNCPSCGEFRIPWLQAEILPETIKTNRDLKGALQRYVREKNKKGDTPTLDQLGIDEAYQKQPLSPSEPE